METYRCWSLICSVIFVNIRYTTFPWSIVRLPNDTITSVHGAKCCHINYTFHLITKCILYCGAYVIQWSQYKLRSEWKGRQRIETNYTTCAGEFNLMFSTMYLYCYNCPYCNSHKDKCFDSIQVQNIKVV